jgi:hypothetical protein
MKGKWFPDWRTGTREQCARYRQACWNLFRNSRDEQAAGIRDETPASNRLHDQLYATERPLTRRQQSWHWGRALTAEDKDHFRLQRQADRQRKQARSVKSR